VRGNKWTSWVWVSWLGNAAWAQWMGIDDDGTLWFPAAHVLAPDHQIQADAERDGEPTRSYGGRLYVRPAYLCRIGDKKMRRRMKRFRKQGAKVYAMLVIEHMKEAAGIRNPKVRFGK
jgi:hypothetical protein